MRIEDLQIFSDVVRYHSMNIAAEKHYMTPQNLSKIIKNMEKELDIVLFQRSKRGSELTSEGERFYLQVIKVLLEYEKALETIYDKEKDYSKNELVKTKINVLSHQGAIFYAIMNAYKMMESEGEHDIYLDLKTEKFNYDEKFINSVKENNYDIIAMIVKESDINAIVDSCKNYIPMNIVQEEYVMLVSRTNPLASRRAVAQSELSNLNFALIKDGPIYKDIFGADIPPRIMLDSIRDLIEQIEYSNNLCTFICKSTLQSSSAFKDNSNLVIVPLEQKFYGTFIVLLNKKASGNTAIKTFTQKIGDVLSSNSSY